MFREKDFLHRYIDPFWHLPSCSSQGLIKEKTGTGVGVLCVHSTASKLS